MLIWFTHTEKYMTLWNRGEIGVIFLTHLFDFRSYVRVVLEKADVMIFKIAN